MNAPAAPTSPMKTLVLSVLTASGALAQPPGLPALPTDNPLRTELDRQIDSVVTAFMHHTRTVGVSIGVLHGDSTFFFNYGETRNGNATLPDRNTLYEIGAISKTFTATLLAEAARRGHIDLNAPVNSFLPDSIPLLRKNGLPVTLKHLANHTSGLPRLPPNLAEDSPLAPLNPYKHYDRRRLFAYLMNADLSREPGEAVAYSNLGVGLLGTLLENGLNRSYETLLKERIAGPLGMVNTTLAPTEEQSRRLAQGHTGGGSLASPWDFAAMAGAGGIRSTPSDLLRYLGAQLGNGPRTLVRAMELTREKTAMQADRAVGLGWFWKTRVSHPWCWHTGTTGGFSAFAAFNVRLKTAVVLLTNSQTSADPLSAALLEVLTP